MTTYRHRVIHPVLTAKRREWLEKLDNDPSARRQGRSGFDCQKLGWTDWVYDDDGKIIGEVLTPEGRAVLYAAKEERDDALREKPPAGILPNLAAGNFKEAMAGIAAMQIENGGFTDGH